MSRKTMHKLANQTACTVFVMGLMLVGSTGAWAQETGSSGAPPAATGPDTATQTIENPPLSGLDEPSFEPGFGARSYLIFKAHASESVNTNAAGNLGSKTVLKEVTRGLGSVTLQKLWKVHPLDVDYTGGVVWYNGRNSQTFQLHSLAATQRILWRTGQLAFRDSFTYLPQGGFGSSSFGGVGGLGGLGGGVTSGGGIAGGAGGGLFSNAQFGSIGNQPRITNMSIVDVTQELSPRSSVTLAGGYGLTNFLNNPQGFINSQTTTAQAGYNYKLSRRDQLAVTYGFREFHFPRAGSGSFNTNVWQAFYGHRISGKLDFVAGGGPQWIHVNSPLRGNISFVSGVGRASLIYHESARTDMRASYSHYTNAGSGFFAGSNTDAVRFGVSHVLARRWTATVDAGYSHHKRVLAVPSLTAGNSRTYKFWYAGGSMRRQLSRQFAAHASYQYDDINFSSGFCGVANPSCSRGYSRHVGLIGLEWTPRPIRLD